MRIAAFLSTALIATAAAFAAQAGPLGPVASINITIGEDLAEKSRKYGARELDYLTAELRESVERSLGRSGDLAATGGTLDLVIEDAVPNRPTFQQMTASPGLSYESFGIGGAEISGVLTTADGRTIPLRYRWYESDIRWSMATGTWSDATSTFDRFSRKLAKGEALAGR